MRTRAGVFYDLRLSTYYTVIGELKYMFSSDIHLTKFLEQLTPHRKEFNERLRIRYKINTEFKVYPDIVLYKKIESRGFLICNHEGVKLCLENLLLIGEKATRKD